MILKKTKGKRLIVFTKDQLIRLIKKTIEREGPNCNLNFLDTFRITDMSCLFYFSKFVGDISEWNVSNVRSMNGMFASSSFNGDISKWNVEKVVSMRYMFANSRFIGDLNEWNPASLTKEGARFIFHKNPLSSCPPKWYNAYGN